MKPFSRICAAIAPLFLLSACLLTPGKFTSTLDVRADRSFTFAYTGEVIASNFGDDLKNMGKSGDDAPDEDDPDEQGTAYYHQISSGAAATDSGEDGKGDDDGDEQEKQAKMQAIADALAKEDGYRSIRYIGDNKFDIDYRISGRLDHSFLFPFNIDAQAVFPFVAIEVRKDGKVRVQAPGFASDNDASGGPMGGMGADKSAKEREGTFTLTTDAKIVSQNQEDGAIDTPSGKQIVWKITPLTHIAPMAVLEFADGE